MPDLMKSVGLLSYLCKNRALEARINILRSDYKIKINHEHQA